MIFPTKRLICLLLVAAPLLARADGAEVVVIYNSNLPESKAVAEHYAQARQVPAKQVFGFPLPASEEISRAEFHDSLQMPLLKKLESVGLWKFGSVTIPAANGQPAREGRKVTASKIRCAVLCYGLPLKIRSEMDIHEPVATNMLAELRRNEAAVDSELAWLPLVRMNFPLTGPYPNWLYGATNAALFNPTNGILMVARLDGPTPEIANKLVDKAQLWSISCTRPSGNVDSRLSLRPPSRSTWISSRVRRSKERNGSRNHSRCLRATRSRPTLHSVS